MKLACSLLLLAVQASALPHLVFNLVRGVCPA